MKTSFEWSFSQVIEISIARSKNYAEQALLSLDKTILNPVIFSCVSDSVPSGGGAAGLAPPSAGYDSGLGHRDARQLCCWAIKGTSLPVSGKLQFMAF